MNRMEEYRQLVNELDMPVPELEGTFARAKKRNRLRKWIWRPAAGAAAVFVCFVLLVNFCAPVAYACSLVPGLKELARAVTFSRSLTDAVEHEYIQPIEMVLTDKGVTLSVEYLIVDQRQVNVFFRLDSENYTHMSIIPAVFSEDETYQQGCVYACNDTEVPNGRLQSMTIDFIDHAVPERLHIRFEIEDLHEWQMEEAVKKDTSYTERADKVAMFDFLLKFDPEFTASGRVVTVNRAVEIDGQKLLFTTLEIYPTHLRVNVEGEKENTAWLKQLNFYLETDWGMKFEPVTNGIIATGEEDSPMMVSYRADSSYFYEARHLKLVVTGARWLDKSMERICVDLKTGKADRLPEGVEIASVERTGTDFLITIRAKAEKKDALHQLFYGSYYDSTGTEYWREEWTTRWEEVESGEEGYYIETFPLKNYSESKVWLSPCYSSEWKAEEEIEIIGW